MCPRWSRPRSAAKQGRSFRVAPINSAPTRFSRGSPDPKIRKWTLECSCVPKGVGAAFCSKTAPFLSCAPNKPSGGSCARPRRSRPRSAAKQGRSFRVTPINSTRFSGATSWERVPPEIGHRPSLKRTFYEKNLMWQNPAFISRSRNEGLGWRILAPDTWEPGS